MELKVQCTGYSVAVDLHEGTDPNNILIILPGFSSSKANQKINAEHMVKGTGTSAVVIDFSGHGTSPIELRDTRPAQHFLELIHVFDWVRLRYPDAVISVSGSSYGGFMAVQLTKYREFANLILRAPAIYRPSAFYDSWSLRYDDETAYLQDMNQYRSNADELNGHPLLARASAFAGRTLVVVHENDTLIPTQTTNAFIDAFHADSFVAKGFDHTINPSKLGQDQLAGYWAHIVHWLNQEKIDMNG